MNLSLKLPLRLTIPLSLLLWSVATGLALWHRNAEQAEQADESSESSEMRSRLTLLQGSVESLMRKGDPEGVLRQISDLGSLQNSQTAFLTDEDGVVLASTRYDTIGQPVHEALPALRVKDPDSFEAAAQRARTTMSSKVTITSDRLSVAGYTPVVLGNRRDELRSNRIGLLFIQSDLAPQKQADRLLAGRQVLEFSVVLALLAAILWLVFHFTLTKPMSRLLAATQRFAAGGLDTRTGMSGRDELSIVGRAFDQMAARIEAEQARLKESEERYRQLFENASDIVFTSDTSGMLASINAAGERVLGYSGEELLHMNLRDLAAPESEETVTQMMDPRQPETQPGRFDFEATAKNGQRVSLEVSRRLVTYADGSAVVQGIARDVSDRKVIEEQLRQAQRMEAIGTLAGGVAHDFNNILTGIIGYASLGLDDSPADHPMREILSHVKLLGERAANLTRQILAFARRQMLQRRPLSLNTVISEFSKLLERLTGEHIELHLELCRGLKLVSADRSQIEQILINLCVNARDAMPDGGKLLIATENTTRDGLQLRSIQGAAQSDYVMLRIQDAGQGMDRQTLGRIFEPFFTTKPPGEGTGLGLSMVYGIVKQHDGFIEVSSEIGSGADVRIYLPAVAAPSEPISEPLERLLGSNSGTILVAEDEELVRNLVVSILARAGFTVLQGANGEEALRQFEAADGKVDLIISDAVMPRMGGKELIEAISAKGGHPKVVFMTGYSTAMIEGSSDGSPGIDCIRKPFDPQELLRRVRKALEAPSPSSEKNT